NMLSHLWSKHRIDKDHPEGTNTNDSIIKAMHIITKRRQEKIAPEFQIPYEKTVKKMIDKAYNWSRDQLFGIINIDGRYVNLMTDLWSSKTNQAYIGVTVTWINSNFELKEALLTIQLLPSPHTAEAIEDSLNQVITNWGLTGPYTSTEYAQEKCRYPKIYQTIDDVPTRWNSSYLAWVQLKELQKAIDYLVLMLPSESKRCDRLDGEYLKLINLTKTEWRLLDNLISLLKPFYEATNIFSGSNYPTLNLIYPTMRLLIKKFAPSYEQSKDDYADLLFEPINRHEDDPESDIENKFDTLVSSEQLQQPLQAAQGRRNKHDHSKVKKSTYNDSRFKGRQLIETPITNEGLCDLVKAACFLSLKEYWEVPKKIGLVASFLDPRIKSLKFLGDKTIKATTIDTVRTLCIEEDNHQPSVRLDELFKTPDREPATTNSLIAALYSNEELNNEIYNETKVDCYLREPIEKRGCDPLTCRANDVSQTQHAALSYFQAG
ncbi:1660_t:CDS:2, partial [Scutellospora calospora]